MADVIRGTFPAPQPRTSILGVDIENEVKFDVAAKKVRGFYAEYDQVGPDGTARRIVSNSYELDLTQAEWNQLAAVLQAVFGRALPPGTTFSLVTVP